MKIIVITSPDFIAGEAKLIESLFAEGLYTLHLRKPGATADDCRRLLDALPTDCLSRIVVHQHFGLCLDYGLLGVHLNARCPEPPAYFSPRSLSASCHTIAEAARRKASLSYVFLSPIFNSISKQGYGAAFAPEQLANAAARGDIDERVIALGGVTAEAFPLLRQWRFGGAALLGDVWGRAADGSFLPHFRETVRAAEG